MAATNGYTPTQRKILSILSDGYAHTRDELFAALPDDLGASNNLHVHITAIRDKLRPIGQDIVCHREKSGAIFRHVRLISIRE